jgi:hypothetical protein
MSVTLDNQRIFADDLPIIKVESLKRSYIESSAAGLNGIISIDLGSRGRKIKQTGHLRARSNAELSELIAVIEAFLDGKAHTLISTNDGTYEDLRMDTFKIIQRHNSGVGVMAEYEINYTQLRWSKSGKVRKV